MNETCEDFVTSMRIWDGLKKFLIKELAKKNWLNARFLNKERLYKKQSTGTFEYQELVELQKALVR